MPRLLVKLHNTSDPNIWDNVNLERLYCYCNIWQRAMHILHKLIYYFFIKDITHHKTSLKKKKCHQIKMLTVLGRLQHNKLLSSWLVHGRQLRNYIEIYFQLFQLFSSTITDQTKISQKFEF